jgi:hypothetical protein
MLFRQRVDRSRDALRIEAGVGLAVVLVVSLCDDVIHCLTGYRTAAALSRGIVGEQHPHAALARSWATLFSPARLAWSDFPVDLDV